MTTEELEKKLKISKNTCIHCTTEELAKQVLNIFHQLGLKWCNEKNYMIYTNWDSHKENTIYYPFEGEFSSLEFADLTGYKIINAEEFIALHTEEEIKVCSKCHKEKSLSEFHKKGNNAETLEETIKEIKENLISLCEAPNYEEDNYAAGYIAAIEEKTSEIFKAGVEFAQKWVDINKESPQYYQTVLADNGKYMAVVARVSDGDEDFFPICGTNVYMYPDPIKWKFVTLK